MEFLNYMSTWLMVWSVFIIATYLLGTYIMNPILAIFSMIIVSCLIFKAVKFIRRGKEAKP